MRPLADALAAWTESERTTRTQFVAWSTASVLALLVALFWVVRTAKPITSEPRPPAIVDRDGNGVRFGMPEWRRREIFKEMAAAEPASRANGIAGFPNQPWSQEDHRCAFERDTVRALAGRYGITLTEAYLVLDEGIREHWLGPDGKPLTPKTVPLMPRRK
jgi:hypothetical protein